MVHPPARVASRLGPLARRVPWPMADFDARALNWRFVVPDEPAGLLLLPAEGVQLVLQDHLDPRTERFGENTVLVRLPAFGLGSRQIGIPQVVMHRLEIPLQSSRQRIHRNDGVAE